MTDQNRSDLSGLVKLIRWILLLFVSIGLFGGVVLGDYFLQYYSSWQEAFLQGLFASISATTNAGFDITGSSLVPYAHDYFVQFINILLLILGAIGFSILIATKEYLFHKEKIPYRFSLYEKLTTATFYLLVVLGGLGIYLLEYSLFFALFVYIVVISSDF